MIEEQKTVLSRLIQKNVEVFHMPLESAIYMALADMGF